MIYGFEKIVEERIRRAQKGAISRIQKINKITSPVE
jgi:hypothetical protein